MLCAVMTGFMDARFSARRRQQYFRGPTSAGIVARTSLRANEPYLAAEITARPTEGPKTGALDGQPLGHTGAQSPPVKAFMAMEAFPLLRGKFTPVYRPVDGGPLAGKNHRPELGDRVSLGTQAAPPSYGPAELLEDQTGATLNRSADDDGPIGGCQSAQ